MSGLNETIRILARRGTNAAFDLLKYALLDSPAEVSELAALEMLSLSGSRGRQELILHSNRLSPRVIDAMKLKSHEFTFLFEQLFEHGDQHTKRRVLETILLIEACNSFPLVLSASNDTDPDIGDLAVEVFQALVEQIYESQQTFTKSSLVDEVNEQRKHLATILSLLEHEVERIEEYNDPGLVIEAILILTNPQHPSARKLLKSNSEITKGIAYQLLRYGTHPGILRFLHESLKEKYCSPRVIDAISARSDTGFIIYLLQSIAGKRQASLERNLREIDGFLWMIPQESMLAVVPEELHPDLIELIMMTGLPTDEKVELLEVVLAKGSLAGRIAMSDYMNLIEPGRLHEIILDSIRDGSPEIQAWATSMLRSRHVPNAMEILVYQLNHADEKVRRAAAQELNDFSIERILEMMEKLQGQELKNAGELLRQIDINCFHKLAVELNNPIRQRQFKVLDAIESLGFVDSMLGDLLPLTKHSDPYMRRRAIEVLMHTTNTDIILVMQNALTDPHPRVQEAANKGLLVMQQKAHANTPEMASSGA